MVNFTVTSSNEIEKQAREIYFSLLRAHNIELELYNENSDESLYIINSNYCWMLEKVLETKNREGLEKHLKFISDLGKGKNALLINLLVTDIYPDLEHEGIEKEKYR